MTYQEAYNKIIDAYFKDEIKPYNRDFCFCGTIGKAERHIGNFVYTSWDYEMYSSSQYYKMEKALLTIIRDNTIGGFKDDIYVQDSAARDLIRRHPNYEDALFAGMSAALDVLKQIHIERGEIIDEVPVFTKRQKVS